VLKKKLDDQLFSANLGAEFAEGSLFAIAGNPDGELLAKFLSNALLELDDLPIVDAALTREEAARLL
jgi:hypothetical protein